MYINAVSLFSKTPYNPVKHDHTNFTELWEDENEGEFGEDGMSYGAALRDMLRWHLYGRFLPVVDPNEDASSQMRYANTLEDVHIKNFRRLPNSSYSGESLIHHPEFFKLLPASGVHRVIDIKSNPQVKKACEENHIEYVSYNTAWGYGGKSFFKDKEQVLKEHATQLMKEGATKQDYESAMTYYEKRLNEERDTYIKELKEFIDIVNMGHYYMACELGDYRTVNALSLVTTFNPGWYGAKIKPHGTYVPKLVNLYNNLSEENKKTLGIDEKYDEYLKTYLEKLNNVHIMDLRELPNSSYAGEFLLDTPGRTKLLKPIDIKCVIGLNDNPKFKAACEAENIEFHHFDTKLKDNSQYIFDDTQCLAFAKATKLRREGVSDAEYNREMKLFKDNIKEEIDAYVNNFAEIINIVNKGNYCIASGKDTGSATNALALVSIFNPNWQGEKIRPNPEYTYHFINFYNNLSCENKKTLGFNEDIEKSLSEYLKKLV